LSSNAPPAPPHAIVAIGAQVLAAGAQLQEVAFNLINNAVEAMSTMTNRSRVLRVRTEGSWSR
jgi:C4-dicarboxylate-specific signal transduction histidine kinase